MSTTQEKHVFQAEVSELLDLMIHSLYSNREIFLRELVSNASDALDKLRVEALSNDELLGVDKRLCIRIQIEPQKRLLRIIDNGIGMSRDELLENLGTIARSGTRRYLESLRSAGEDGESGEPVPELIGQFGVGFYSAFMVADRVTVDTWRAGEETGTRWISEGKGDFLLEDIEGGARGTSIELELKPRDEDDSNWQDFTDARVLAGLIARYSDFVEYPIEMAAAHLPDAPEDRKSTSEEGIEVVRLNSMKPLWARPRSEITEDEYAEFYKHLTHQWDSPLETVHLNVEGATSWTALLYVPSERPLDLFEPQKDKSRLSLYVKRIFIMNDCEELLPPWLRFVRGLVDAQDLPLNVSREILQENRAVAKIRERLTKKLLDTFETLLADRREDYASFWAGFGQILKEGIVIEPDKAERVAGLCLFETSGGEERTTLDEYIERMGDREEIWVLEAGDREAALSSPHLEAFAAREQEVLFLTDPVDEWVVQRLPEYKGKRLVQIDQGEVDLGGEAAKEALEEKEREHRDLLEALETVLSERVSSVRFSSRLTDSAAVLVDEAGAPGKHMERMMRQAGRDVPVRKRVLELNPDHAVVAKLGELHAADKGSDRLGEFAELLLGQAFLAEGAPLPDPKRFAELVSRLMIEG